MPKKESLLRHNILQAEGSNFQDLIGQKNWGQYQKNVIAETSLYHNHWRWTPKLPEIDFPLPHWLYDKL